MPEILEIEQYRRLAERVVGRCISDVDAPDAWFLKEGIDAASLGSAITGRCIEQIRRIGKLLLVDLADGPTLGLRFGMTGRLVVDGLAAIDALEYGPARDDSTWHRFRLRFAGGGTLVVSDPRRLGGVILDPDERVLGADALTVTEQQLRCALDRSRAPLKARLMDQQRVAGLGNLLTDEVLWRAGLDPTRPAGSLGDDDVRALCASMRETLRVLASRGGSHTGDLQEQRRRGGVCPRDGEPLLRRTVAGRTTYSCPLHQR